MGSKRTLLQHLLYLGVFEIQFQTNVLVVAAEQLFIEVVKLLLDHERIKKFNQESMTAQFLHSSKLDICSEPLS